MPEPVKADNVQETDQPTVTTQGEDQGQEPMTQDSKLFTEMQLQSEVDRRVSKALEKVRQEAEAERLKTEGKWKELYEQEQQRAKRAEYTSNLQKLFSQKQVPDFSDAILNFDPSNLESVEALVNKIVEVSTAKVQAEVNQRLETKKPVQNATPSKSFSDMSADDILKLSPEQLAEWRKAKGIY